MKRLTQTLAFCLLTVFTAVAQKNYVSEVWVSDLGNGKYKNPVLYADYSDPDACRVGDDFYMTSSSFNCLPGLQILHSKDLVNWTIIGAAVPNALSPIETPERPEHGNRVWAPAIRHHNGEFYIFWGDPDQGAFMVKAKDPKGPWSEPVLVKPGKGIIDTCPFWDDDWFSRIIGFFIVSLPMYLLDCAIPNCFGGGDIKMMAVCGVLLGWVNTLVAMFIGVLICGLIACILLLRKQADRKMHIAFGPYLAFGVGAAMLYGEPLLRSYFALFGL